MEFSELNFNHRYPSVNDLKKRAAKRIPGFTFDYLVGGCNEDVNLNRNKSDLREIELKPYYLRSYSGPSMQTHLLGETYSAPFGVPPIGLQGLMWPNSPEILAKAALQHNIPFVLSTVSTESIERISEISEGKAWIQLYHPAENKLRDDLIKRAEAAQCPVLVVLSDVPTFGFRPRDIRNGLSMPPKMSLKNLFQIFKRPVWALQTLKYGKPTFRMLQPYMDKNLNMSELGNFMNETFDGRLTVDRLKQIRDLWKGKLVIKGIVNTEDAQKAISVGVDGIIVSNHGGRQLDAGQSTIKSLKGMSDQIGDKTTLMMDGGIRSGPDIARSIACGAKFTFPGRPFMYGVCALGKAGGSHTMGLFKSQLQQVMEQLCCEKIEDLPQHLI